MAWIRSRAAAAKALGKETGTMTISDADRLALDALGIAVPQPAAGGTVAVEGVMEAVATVTFELDGIPVVVASRAGGRLGTLAAADSAIVKARGDMFKPLLLPISYR